MTIGAVLERPSQSYQLMTIDVLLEGSWAGLFSI